ncbi:DUF1214 domain-containing protein [Pseudomonas sp. LA21]|uniref:DUF1214 domain-containing protein n=1 Tax=unclassified Pseudomonas TaxID=196821 RepID=UPI001FB77563|nr:DUF1214 domain-containing protein [Pseudomonas sp. LA21]MCJ1887050.1 DUF1214 domain-containing protein [Pseudomonas sp. LA21]
MKSPVSRYLAGLILTPLCILQAAATTPSTAIPVNVDNFVRAESDRYFAAMAQRDGLGKLRHNRELASIDKQTVIRLNRDTLYSVGVFDLDAGPVSVTLPDAGKRYLSMQVINEDHFVQGMFYRPGVHQLTRDSVGTRYAAVGIRVLADPESPQDMKEAHALQDLIKVEQRGSGRLELPAWEKSSQDKVRAALLALAELEPDLNRAFGRQNEVDPVRHLIATASAWGGNPSQDAIYLNVTPQRNDGVTPYELRVKDVPVDAFWSVSVYNDKGYFVANPRNAYSLNSVTAKKESDGAIRVRFGNCDEQPNCLPIMPGWNYMVRLYQPQSSVLAGSWRFPEATPAN